MTADDSGEPTGTRIRPIAAEDIDAVVEFALRAWAPVFASFERVMGAEIYRRVYPDWLASQSEAVANACRGDHVWVAVRAGRAVGFATVILRDTQPATAEIDMIAVDPDHQREGIASALLAVALDYMRSAGAQLAEIGTGGDPGHAAARLLYESAGFTPLPLVRYYKAL